VIEFFPLKHSEAEELANLLTLSLTLSRPLHPFLITGQSSSSSSRSSFFINHRPSFMSSGPSLR